MILLLALFLRAVPAGAQLFHPHCYLSPQFGMSWTVGETSAANLLWPAFDVSAGYQFHPVVGLQLGLSGWQARNGIAHPKSQYKWYYVQPNLDVVLSVPNMFGYRPDRQWDVYLLAGIGLNIAFHNDEANALAAQQGTYNSFGLLWDGTLCLPVGRFGLGAAYWVHPRVALTLEANANFLSDAWNSKYGRGPANVDWQNHLLVGVRIALMDTKIEEPVPEEVLPTIPEEDEAERIEQERLEREREEARLLAQQQAEQARQDSIAAAEYEREVRERPRREAFASTHKVYYKFSSTKVREEDSSQLEKMITFMHQYPDFQLHIIGYSSPDGNPTYNQWLANWRAKALKNRFVKGGIDPERITYEGAIHPTTDKLEGRSAICSFFLKEE